MASVLFDKEPLDTDFTNIEAAIRFANKASSLAVQKLGAIPSIPTYAEISANN